MLTGALKRRARTRLPPSIAQSFDELQLPWLCPAVLKCINQPRRYGQLTSGGPVSKVQRPRRKSIPSLTPVSRQLATAAEARPHSTVQDFITYQESASSHDNPRLSYPSATDSPPQSLLRPFDPQDFIAIDRQPYNEVPRFSQAFYSGHLHMTGNVTDLCQSLSACVKVGRFDRAQLLVRRLSWLLNPASPQIVAAHHEYLTGVLGPLLLAPSAEKFSSMQQWFELDILARDIVPTPGILSTMMKGALRTLGGSRLDRTIRRYLSIAERIGGNVLDDTMSSNLFTDVEWSKIVRLCPQWYGAPLEELSESDLLETGSADQEPSIAIKAESESVQAPSELQTEIREQVPELRPAQLKGLGLKALRKSLSSMISKEARVNQEDFELPTDPLLLQQQRLEEDAITSALEKWREEAETTQAVKGTGAIKDPVLGSVIYTWIQDMSSLVKEEITKSDLLDKEMIQKPSDLDRFLLGPFLKLVEPEILSAAALLAFLQNVNRLAHQDDTLETTTVSAASRIGEALVAEMQAESIKSSLMDKKFSLPSAKRQQKLANLVRRSKKNSIPVSAQKPQNVVEAGKADEPELQVTRGNQIKLGTMFLEFLIQAAKLPISEVDPDTGRKTTKLQAVLSHDYRFVAEKRKGIIKIHEQLFARLKKEPVGSLIAKTLPMVVKPREWISLRSGGYISTSISAVRFNDYSKSQQEHLVLASKRGDMSTVYAALDVVGKVRWRINADVFKVVTEAWNTGEPIGGLAPENPVPNYPPEPESSDTKARWRWRRVVKNIDNEIMGFHSQRCYQNFQFEVGRAFLDRDFYCPHNVDFRGRAYPIPPYFNHMGADYVRALFLFAEGRELGETGLKWLKIHLANVYGFDKASLEEREAFATEHLSDILDSASNPLGGRKWWLTAGDPWQCLASCMELKKALELPDPTKHISHLPIHQDGTCNGLQHYAALGGDVQGATQVNLMPGDKPGDVYSAIAALVQEAVTEGVKKGEKAALALDGKITRKVVKQPVMTNVYGVTFHGAKLQVKKQLVDILPKENVDNDINIDYLSFYVAKEIFAALGKIFSGAQAIQSWLGECGARISQAVRPEQIERLRKRGSSKELPKDHRKMRIPSQRARFLKEDFQFNSTIIWTTPLGMPVVQPYRDLRVQHIKTNLQSVDIHESTLNEPVSKRKQLQGFPPNFIHSLDASHMMLSALQCSAAGLEFSAVHDSFWTHACDVPTMSKILRDTFVQIHSKDVIERLREEFLIRYKGCFHWSSIPGDSPLALQIKKLRKSRQRLLTPFTKRQIKPGAQIDELVEEAQRIRLLQSKDPRERKKGKKMQTPAALLAAEEDAASLDLRVEEVEVEAEEENSAKETKADGEAAEGEANSVQHQARPSKRRIFLWTPLTFPPRPERGDFDLQRVKDSRYFFS